MLSLLIPNHLRARQELSIRSRSLLRIKSKKSESNHDYRCCFCRFFELEGYRWGYCQKLGVEVNGNCPACSVAEPFFSLSQNQSDTKDAKVKQKV